MKGKHTIVSLLALLALSAYAAGQTPVAVHTFICNGSAFQRSGSCLQGGRPDSLIQGSNGTFYGAAQDSAEGTSSPTGGTVFSVTSAGQFALLHTFSPGSNKTYPNGNLPGGITQGPDGKLYGATAYGGNQGCNGYCGYGVLYRVNTNGTGFEIIHKLCSEANCADGSAADGALVLGSDGKLYSTSYYGGANNGGTIFQITPSSGAYKVVFNFSFSTTGENPGGLIVGPNGTFYGITSSSSGQLLFNYNVSTGTVSTVDLNFPEVNGLPSAGSMLTLGPNGNFYGIYGIYGVSGAGLFEVGVDGSNLTLFPFYTTQDGAGAPQGLLLASDGNFWIPNYNGTNGTSSYGDIMTISPTDGSLIQTISPFSSTAAVGAYPAELIQASDGVFWGSTYQYGDASKGHFADGTVFSLNEGLPPRK